MPGAAAVDVAPITPAFAHAAQAACSREGAGIGEALLVIGLLLAAALLAGVALGALAGGLNARKRGRPVVRGALIGAAIPVFAVTVLAGGAIGISQWQQHLERQQHERMNAWLAPLDQLQGGRLRSTLQLLQASAPPIPWARQRLGNELRSRLQYADIAWSADDLAAAAEFTPAPWGMAATLAFARHGLADLSAAMDALAGQGEQLVTLVELASERCRIDLPRCRELSGPEDWTALRERVGVDVADAYTRMDSQRRVDWVLHQAFAAPRPEY